MPILRNLNRNFFDKWSSEMAYVLGYAFADGSIYKNFNGYYYLEFTSIDRELIKKTRSLLGSSHKISIRHRERENPNYKTSYRLQICVHPIIQNLLKFGIKPNKSLSIKFPKVPSEYFGHFVRGYFDGDGNVSLGNYWRKARNGWSWEFSTRFTSGSRLFLTGLKNALKKYIFGGQIRKKHKRSGYDLIFSRHDSIALFNLMYNNVPAKMFLKRKYNIFKKAFKVLNYEVLRA